MSIAQASRDLDVAENMLLNVYLGLIDDPQQAFPGNGISASASMPG